MFKHTQKKLKLGIFNSLKYIAQKTKNQPTELTCFLAGHQRSGTNMAMDVLEKHWKTEVYHETNDKAFNNYMMRSTDVLQSLQSKSKAQVFVVKALCELDLLDDLMSEFKPAKTIWVIRHYNDVVNSMVRSFNTSAMFYKAIKEDKSAGAWRTRNLSDENYQRIQRLVTDDISEESAAALQWAIRNLIFFEKGFEQNADVLLINYEALVSKPTLTFPQIYQFLGLEDNPNTYQHVYQSSIGKNKQPNIAPDIKQLCDEVWHLFTDKFIY